MSSATLSTNSREFKSNVRNPMGRPTKLSTLLRRAQLKLINDLENRALEGDTTARRELFEMIAQHNAR